ncbi:hypothetical protein CWD77_07835 [Rhodohalobacter barkolensis]|uniref:Uncharacterized protein n=1 Tax=Rhodohalobacter barkolensis TaxID=2053187 RepID=A0A2N0VH23_9BACT|nr:hypothetical protein CWD77_07835 [Rhodohalobacter barkolensis]
MDQDRTYTINEVKDMIMRIQVLYSFLTPKSKRKFKKACNGNKMKKLISIEDLQKYIDPTFPSKKCVLFLLPEGGKESVSVDSFPTLLKNSSVLLKNELTLN